MFIAGAVYGYKYRLGLAFGGLGFKNRMGHVAGPFLYDHDGKAFQCLL